MRVPSNASVSPLPEYRPDAGLAFGKGGMRGAFQMGVLHAFVISGVVPGAVAGTSIGALSAAMLVAASRLPTQAQRLALLDDMLEVWRANPSREVAQQLTDEQGEARALVEDLLDLRLDLSTMVDFVRAWPEASGWQKAKMALRVLAALPLHRPSMARALLRGGGALLWASLTRRGHVAVRGLQGVLSSYGMTERILPGWVVDGFFERMAKWLPRRDVTLEELGRVDERRHIELLVQAANISAESSADSGAAPVLTLPKEGKLEAAVRAAVAAAPIYAPVRVEEVLDWIPSTLNPDDLLVDAAAAAKSPLAVVVRHWRTLPPSEAGPRQLFVVQHTPPQDGRVRYESQSFVHSVVRSAQLAEQRDAQFSERVTRLISSQIRVLREAGVEVPTPPGRPEQRYVEVEPTPIAPPGALPGALAIWSATEIADGIAEGCRSAMTALHADTLRTLEAPGTEVECSRLRAALAKRYTPEEAADYFEGRPMACDGCPKRLRVPEPTKAEATQTQSSPADELLSPPLPGRDAADHRPLTIAVPAGGVFRGVFQVGAIAALRRYEIQPELFAGASVGTLFSYLMEAMARPEGGEQRLSDVVGLMQNIPEWVDARPGAPLGRVDTLFAEMARRWKGTDDDVSDVPQLHSLRPRLLADLIGDPKHERWPGVLAGVQQLLLNPVHDRPTGTSDLTSSRIIDAIFDALNGEHAGGIELLDQILEAWDIFESGKEAEGELIGFESIAPELRAVVFDDRDAPDRPLHSWCEETGVRFLFSGADFERGMPVVFGLPWHEDPLAIEAALAASSFPVAFRRRPHEMLFPRDRGLEMLNEPQAGSTYVDGGVFNNFPSDIAFAFLRRLSRHDDYAWLGDVRHRVLLLSLDPPGQGHEIARRERRALLNAVRARDSGRDDKVYRTWVTQLHIAHLAEVANPLLRDAEEEQAMKVEFDLIEPVRFEYQHAFAFKPVLGFRVAKQYKLLAAGCRRTRVALEWREFRGELHTRADVNDALQRFNEALSEEFAAGRRRDDDTCIFGTRNPTARGTGCETCAFIDADTPGARAIYDACRDDARRDPPLRRLRIYGRSLSFGDR